MATHTSIKDLLELKIMLFYRVYVTVGNVLEKQHNQIK